MRWIAENQRRKRTCCVTTAASNAVRVAHAASRLGISLDGVKFIVTGEPFTEAKREVIARTGAVAIPRYAYGGSINIGYGCANPLYTDELHVNQHLLALLPAPYSHEACGEAVHPFLCTTLHPSFPRLLVNVESGDYGFFTARDCGCSLEKAGLSLHLYRVRSYEKLTSEGMNYFYGDLFEFVEKNLPAEFGGQPGDYQIAEEEDDNGQTRITLIVHPSVGPIDERRALDCVRTVFAKGSRTNLFMTRVWEDAGSFRVRREPPRASPRGKILPLHLARRQAFGAHGDASQQLFLRGARR
ncbi:MAG TPA: hypothetical protein VNO43_18955 [Candidatus Eisenbacteria bacterium]|nr:hypothetical protein [Candidatus Eisenbacteria bacterium]